jgi:iron complex outermembrane receptor protein
MNKLNARWSAAVLCSASFAGATQAQVGTQAPAGQSMSTSFVEEVIVTAERRSESLQRTPLSILAFSGASLERANIRNVEELQNFLPNVSIGGSVPVGNSAPNFSIRGIGQTSGRANNEKGVGLYVDEIYYPRSTGAILNLLDVERIEVLRGPQGTLFGRNTTGGAIRYITRKPTDEFEARLTGTWGSEDRTDVEGLINVPLGEKAAFRGQAAYFKRDGYVDIIGTDDTLGDQEDYAVRGTLRLEPTENLTVDFTAAYTENKSAGSPNVIKALGLVQPNGFPIGPVAAYSAYLTSIGQPPVTVNDPRFVSPDGYSVFDTCILDLVTPDPARFGNAPNLLTNALPREQLCNNGRSTENTFASIDLNWELSDTLAIRSLSGYNDGTDIDQSDYGQVGAQTNRTVNEMESFSQELQLLGDHERFKWVVGLYYFHETPAEKRYNRELTRALPPPRPAVCCVGFDANVQLETDSYAAFGQGTLSITDKARITAGLRYSYDEKSVNISKVGIFTPPLPPGGSPQSNEDNWDALDYRLTLDYQWTDALMTYATVSKGFKSGGFNIDITQVGAAPPQVTSFDPETVENFELGLRSQFLDDRLTANLTGFYMKYDDLVVQLADFSRGALQVLFLNAGKLDVYGFESELSAAVTDGLRLNASVGYTRIDYVDLADNSPLFIASTCLGGPLTDERCTAQTLARSPEWTYTAGANYSHALGTGTVTLSANYSYKDEQFSNNSTSNSVLLPSYSIANVRLEYDSGKFWKVALFGTNVLDEEYITTGTNGTGNVLGTLSVSPGAPAEYGVAATLSF